MVSALDARQSNRRDRIIRGMGHFLFTTSFLLFASDNSDRRCARCPGRSKTAVCRQRVMELLPKVEGVVQSMAESEQVLMGLQEKRQRELWNLLKVACSKVRSPVSGSPDGLPAPSSVPPLLTPRHSLQQFDESLVEESRTFEGRLQSLLHDTIQESQSSMEVLKEWTWLHGGQNFSSDLS